MPKCPDRIFPTYVALVIRLIFSHFALQTIKLKLTKVIQLLLYSFFFSVLQDFTIKKLMIEKSKNIFCKPLDNI